MKIGKFFQDAISKAIEERPIEVSADNIKLSFASKSNCQQKDEPVKRKSHKKKGRSLNDDVVYTIGEATVALALPVGVLAFIL